MASTYINRTMSAGNNNTATYSAWIKKSSQTQGFLFQSYTDNTNYFAIRFKDGNWLNVETVSGTNILEFTPNQYDHRLMDVNAWYHICVVLDSTQATSTNRVKLYVNNVLQDSYSVATYPSQNADLKFNNSSQNNVLGAFYYNSAYSNYFDGMMAHVHWIDGTAYAPTDFAEYDSNGVWKPKTSPSVTYGTNGFFLKFENSSNMDLDSSSNNHTFTTSGNLTQTLDTPANIFATFNPLDVARTSSSTPAFQNGNTTAYNAAADGSYLASTIAVNKGKWYAEFKIGAGTNTRSLGILDVTSSVAYIGHPTSGSATNSYAYNSLSSGGILKDGNTTIASSVGTTTNGDIISVMIDLDSATKTIKFQKNGVDLSGTTQMTISQSSDTYWIFALRADSSQYVYANFGNGYFGTTAVSSGNQDGNGQGIFEYAPPSGYYALCTKNLATYG